MIFEDGKYYTVIKARNTRWVNGSWQEKTAVYGEGADFQAWAEQTTVSECPAGRARASSEWLEVSDRFGKHLILKRHPVLLDYLSDTLQKNQGIAAQIKKEMQVRRAGHRLEMLEKENEMLKKLISWMSFI